MDALRYLSASVFLLFYTASISYVSAEETPFLTVDGLVESGYVQLSGLQLIELLKQHKIEIRDIETDAVSYSRRTETDADSAQSRKSEMVKSARSGYFLDTRLLARAPPLDAGADLKVSGDVVIATDGVRTYRYRFFEKQDKMYGVRDIDHGNVFFEIIVK